jgi:hypothetical protein
LEWLVEQGQLASRRLQPEHKEPQIDEQT